MPACAAPRVLQWGGRNRLLVNTEARCQCVSDVLARLPLRGDETPEQACGLLAAVLKQEPVLDRLTVYSVIMLPGEGRMVRVP